MDSARNLILDGSNKAASKKLQDFLKEREEKEKAEKEEKEENTED